MSRLRYAPSPTASVVSEGAATSASTAEETVHIQQPDGLAGSSSTFDCLQRSSPTSSEDRLRGQHLLSRRFRCAETEAEYLEWHFSIWGWRGMVKHSATPPSRPRAYGTDHERQAASRTAPRGPEVDEHPPAHPLAHPLAHDVASGPGSRAHPYPDPDPYPPPFAHLGGGRRTLRSASRRSCSSTCALCSRGAARAGGHSTSTTVCWRTSAWYVTWLGLGLG